MSALVDVVPPEQQDGDIVSESPAALPPALARDHPPAGTRRARSHALMRRGVYAVVVVAALLAAYLATRTSAHTDGALHSHAAAPAAGDAPVTVRLTPTESRRIGVTYTVATAGLLTRDVRTVGQVTYDETRVKAVAPKVEGWVERLYVNYTGQRVTRGAPLMTVYSPMLIVAQEELLLAKRLADDVAGGTPDAVLGAQQLVASARRRLLHWDVPSSDVEQMERTGTVRRTVTLVAPANGYVIEKNVLAGQKVMSGEELYKIADLGVVWIEGEVFEQDLVAVEIGHAAVAEFEAFPGERWRGRIAYVYPTLNPETRTARIRVELPNEDLKLKPGMYATLVVESVGRVNVLSVPRSAVLATGQRTIVFVKGRDGALEPRAVTVGVATADRIEVREGLIRGDTVVASATFLIDAESNLRSALKGVGITPTRDTVAQGRQHGSAPPTPHSGHRK